ncbi:aminotransferase class III-fold pyridoxal phosphate-dependent enzyme [Tenacibaculum sp. nBUS_03]|uniref:aminotransferase class III-fold pyridoxal phosphate-dependent enzyme n=1 Tax=Tenacibaculum sp. nBUS_03 TaxID=3395320 RepID=UPI003EB9CA65
MINLNVNIKSAKGDYLIDTNNQQYFDLCMGYGSVSLGHNYSPIIKAQQQQIQEYSGPGFLKSTVYKTAKKKIEDYVKGYSVSGFYTSGANAIEIAIKMAFANNNKSKIISFENSMHGKTIFANKLGFESCLNNDNQILKIPFLAKQNESEILEACEIEMQSNLIAAIIIEPIQMSGGGFQASKDFYKSLSGLAKKYQVLQIYDEILTGFHRMGNLFCFYDYEVEPDIIVAGKSIGSGFPVSLILIKNSFKVSSSFRGGGTFHNHPVACASVIATIDAYTQLKVQDKIEAIDVCIKKYLPAQNLSGKGALWSLNMGTKENAFEAVNYLNRNKVIVSFYDKNIRFFPNFQVDTGKLAEVCKMIKPFL